MIIIYSERPVYIINMGSSVSEIYQQNIFSVYSSPSPQRELLTCTIEPTRRPKQSAMLVVCGAVLVDRAMQEATPMEARRKVPASSAISCRHSSLLSVMSDTPMMELVPGEKEKEV